MGNNSRARIIRRQSWKDYFLFSLEFPRIPTEARPGQFLMVRVSEEPYPLLRRPFSIHFRENHTLDVFFQVVGLGTALLAQKKEGDHLDVLGPLGKGFTLGSRLNNKIFVLVGGGRGIAPLYFLAWELRSLGGMVKIYYGGKSLSDLPLKDKFEANDFSVACTTEDGSFGHQGLVSRLLESALEQIRPDSLFACGPEAMMKTIARMARQKKIPAEFSLESQMGCGFGACWGCVKRIKRDGKESWIKICEEGPVFSSEEIIWPEEET